MSRYLVDPRDITRFDRSTRELQTFFLFCVLVAGKNSAIQARKLYEFLNEAPNDLKPFTYISYMLMDGTLRTKMEEHKLGQYTRLERCFAEAIRYSDSLDKVTVTILESIPGIGPKTARFFLTHTRPYQLFAVLDTHVLRWMREHLGVDAPKVTPKGAKYMELERIFVHHCQDVGRTPAEMDLEIWSSYNKGG